MPNYIPVVFSKRGFTDQNRFSDRFSELAVLVKRLLLQGIKRSPSYEIMQIMLRYPEPSGNRRAVIKLEVDEELQTDLDAFYSGLRPYYTSGFSIAKKRAPAATIALLLHRDYNIPVSRVFVNGVLTSEALDLLVERVGKRQANKSPSEALLKFEHKTDQVSEERAVSTSLDKSKKSSAPLEISISKGDIGEILVPTFTVTALPKSFYHFGDCRLGEIAENLESKGNQLLAELDQQ